jgi:hypothetical protein
MRAGPARRTTSPIARVERYTAGGRAAFAENLSTRLIGGTGQPKKLPKPFVVACLTTYRVVPMVPLIPQ